MLSSTGQVEKLSTKQKKIIQVIIVSDPNCHEGRTTLHRSVALYLISNLIGQRPVISEAIELHPTDFSSILLP